LTEESDLRPTHGKNNVPRLDAGSILQINATIIAGALILLTLGNILTDQPGKESIQYTLTILTIVVIMPFSISSMWVLKEKDASLAEAKKYLRVGFLTLMLALLGLAVIVFPGWSVLAKMLVPGN